MLSESELEMAESMLDALAAEPTIDATTEPDHPVDVNPPQTIEDVIKSLVNFSQVVSRSLCNIQDTVGRLTAVVEVQAKEITQLRELIKSNGQENIAPNTFPSDHDEMDKIDESEEYVALLNKMQTRRDALKNQVIEPEYKKESNAVIDAKATILAAAKHYAHQNIEPTVTPCV